MCSRAEPAATRTAAGPGRPHRWRWPASAGPRCCRRCPALAWRITPAGPARMGRCRRRAGCPTWRCSWMPATPPLAARMLSRRAADSADRRRRAARRRRQLADAEPALGRGRTTSSGCSARPRRAAASSAARRRGPAAALKAGAGLGERLRRAALDAPRHPRRRRGPTLRGAGPAHRCAALEAPRPPGLHRRHRPALRPGRGGAVGFRQPWVRVLVRLVTSAAGCDAPRGVRLRQALERLGPIFVKFGQVLSTRRDLLPPTSPTSSRSCRTACRRSRRRGRARWSRRAFGRPIDEVFAQFDAEPVASASIAQVHFARAARTAARSPSRCCGRACWRSSTTTWPAAHAGALGRAAVGRRQAAASRARWWPSSTTTCTTSST